MVRKTGIRVRIPVCAKTPEDGRFAALSLRTLARC
jgi:hypothetical protein